MDHPTPAPTQPLSLCDVESILNNPKSEEAYNRVWWKVRSRDVLLQHTLKIYDFVEPFPLPAGPPSYKYNKGKLFLKKETKEGEWEGRLPGYADRIFHSLQREHATWFDYMVLPPDERWTSDHLPVHAICTVFGEKENDKIAIVTYNWEQEYDAHFVKYVLKQTTSDVDHVLVACQELTLECISKIQSALPRFRVWHACGNRPYAKNYRLACLIWSRHWEPEPKRSPKKVPCTLFPASTGRMQHVGHAKGMMSVPVTLKSGKTLQFCSVHAPFKDETVTKLSFDTIKKNVSLLKTDSPYVIVAGDFNSRSPIGDLQYVKKVEYKECAVNENNV